ALRRDRCTLARDRRCEERARRGARARVSAFAERALSSKARSDKAVRERRRPKGPIPDRPGAPRGNCGCETLAGRVRGCDERARERPPGRKGGGAELLRAARAPFRA